MKETSNVLKSIKILTLYWRPIDGDINLTAVDKEIYSLMNKSSFIKARIDSLKRMAKDIYVTSFGDMNYLEISMAPQFAGTLNDVWSALYREKNGTLRDYEINGPSINILDWSVLMDQGVDFKFDVENFTDEELKRAFGELVVYGTNANCKAIDYAIRVTNAATRVNMHVNDAHITVDMYYDLYKGQFDTIMDVFNTPFSEMVKETRDFEKRCKTGFLREVDLASYEAKKYRGGWETIPNWSRDR